MSKDKKSFFREMWEGFRSLPTWAQIAIAIVVAIVIYRLVTWLFTRIKQGNINAKLNGEKSSFEAAGETLSYPPTSYDTYANQIFNAMNGTGTGEDEITAVFDKMKNNLDVIELTKAFGTRDLSYYYFWTYTFTLGEALTDELGQDYIDEINKKLKSRGIQYQY